MKSIQQLTELWYRIVSLDHHKDRDCHWYINKVWSYGNNPIYRIEHYGYIWEDVSEEYNTYKEAEKRLKEIIMEAMEEESNWAKKVISEGSNEWGDDQIERANGILTLLNK